VSLVWSHQTVGVALVASEPPGLLGELGNHKDRLEDVTVWVALPLRRYGFVSQPKMAGQLDVENWFYGAPDREVHPQGRIFYIPNFKLAALALAAIAAGYAGTLNALYMPIVSPEIATMGYTVEGLLIILIGGMGTLSGAMGGVSPAGLLPAQMVR
jgi:hypothetical protein